MCIRDRDKRTEIPKLSRTGIREIDGFSTAITQLSQDILDTSTKFLRIMDMASIEPVSYTHLDVYKRQGRYRRNRPHPH